MKMMKWALLGGAALAVTATAARAEDLADLKAQIEALQNRVTQLEAQPQASMPSGYSLMAIRDGQGTFQGMAPQKYGDMIREDSGFTLSVLPTADAAPVAEVSVSGEIRTALIYTDDNSNEDDDDSIDVANRGRIFIRGKAETAVGEVGGYFRLQASGGGDFSDYDETTAMNKAYGWWQFTPEWKLLAGYEDNTGALQTSYDWNVSSIPIRTVGPSNIANEQFRLTYTSGPLAFAISVEDPDPIDHTGHTDGVDRSDLPNLQAYLMYSSDAFTAQVVGLIQDDDSDDLAGVEGGDLDWAVGGGVTFGLAETFILVAGVVIGEGTSSYANNVGPGTADDDFWAGSAGVIANLSEDTRLELGVGLEDYDLGGEAFGVNGGIFWDPVSQVTVGFGATYVEFDDAVSRDQDDFETLQVYFGTWLRFP